MRLLSSTHSFEEIVSPRTSKGYANPLHVSGKILAPIVRLGRNATFGHVIGCPLTWVQVSGQKSRTFRRSTLGKLRWSDWWMKTTKGSWRTVSTALVNSNDSETHLLRPPSWPHTSFSKQSQSLEEVPSFRARQKLTGCPADSGLACPTEGSARNETKAW